MTRRRTSLVCAAVLIAGMPALVRSAAAAAPERAVSVSYQLPGGTTTGTTTTTSSSPTATDTARSDEDRVTVSAQDVSGGAVALAVDLTPPGATTATRYLLCSSGALAVRGQTVVAVTPLLGRCADGRLSLPRGGHVVLSFHRKPVPRGIASPAHRYALLVGIEDYAGSTHSTVGGVGDVQAVRQALLGSGWQSSHIRTLTNGAATATAIRAGMDWLVAHSSPQTFSLFHYSGHTCIASRGPCASGHSYLWSYDNSFIPDNEVVGKLTRIQGKQWLDVSACEGGSFDLGYSSPNRLFTGASQPSETAYEEPNWNESVWTGLAWDYGYNRGLADPHGRGMHATIAQLATYGVQQAPSYTAKQARGPQHPVFRGGAATWSLAAPPGG